MRTNVACSLGGQRIDSVTHRLTFTRIGTSGIVVGFSMNQGTIWKII